MYRCLSILSPHKWLSPHRKWGGKLWHIFDLFLSLPASANKGGVGVHKVLNGLYDHSARALE